MGKKVSVVIPYYQRREHLLQVLTALREQTMPAQDYEVLVVDDGSQELLKKQSCVPFQVLRIPHSGAATARNEGLRRAQGELVIFLDSDIVVAPSFVLSHYQYYLDHPDTVILGPRQHLSPEGLALASTDTRLKLLARYQRSVGELRHPWFMAYTCNVSLARKWALRECFDESFVNWGLEDSEWAYRLYKRGLSFAFLFEATARHLYHDRSMSQEKFRGWQANLSYLMSKHPELSFLEVFTDVFDPSVQADYFSAYDQFEDVSCLSTC